MFKISRKHIYRGLGSKLLLGLASLLVGVGIITFVMVITSGCGPLGPKQTVEKYIDALSRKDAAVVYELHCTSDKNLVTMGEMKAILIETAETNYNHIEITEVTESGDSAMVTLKNKVTLDTLYWGLIKENDEWKMSIFDMTSDSQIEEEQNLQRYLDDYYYDYYKEENYY